MWSQGDSIVRAAGGSTGRFHLTSNRESTHVWTDTLLGERDLWARADRKRSKSVLQAVRRAGSLIDRGARSREHLRHDRRAAEAALLNDVKELARPYRSTSNAPTDLPSLALWHHDAWPHSRYRLPVTSPPPLRFVSANSLIVESCCYAIACYAERGRIQNAAGTLKQHAEADR